MSNRCNICGSTSGFIFSSLVLQKYNAEYFQCESCNFIQTERPFWLAEAYEAAITDLDIGLVYRNIQFSDLLEKMLLRDVVDQNGRFIDYGGGYGLFVRLMRDKGFDFYRQDIHCRNLFANHFDITDINEPGKFELLTAFEVFEHLEDPFAEVEKMLTFSDNILFSTELVPHKNATPASWWYFTPETGQHISFYTAKSLNVIAGKFKLYFYSNGSSLHMFSKRRLGTDPFVKLHPKGRLRKILELLEPEPPQKKRAGLLQQDFDFIRHQFYGEKAKKNADNTL